MRVLHAIHDFLPRHQAGSEIYAFELARALSRRHHVTVLCADFDPARAHGDVVWRDCAGISVVEIINNWVCSSFEHTYRPPLVTDRIAQLLRAVQPDIVHVHNLLNLSFALPALAKARGVPVVATLHDYTLVCPAGGQRVHQAERHVCHSIDTGRCARCFAESPFAAQMSFGAIAGAPPFARRIAATLARRLPILTRPLTSAANKARSIGPTRQQIDTRLSHARELFSVIDLFVAPSPSIALEFEALGVSSSKIRVSDYGVVHPAGLAPPRSQTAAPLRIGFAGTIVWHKGVHVLIDALRHLPAGKCELKIFGRSDTFPAYVAELKKLALGLPVHFMGPFERERIADAYAQIDVLAVPSLWLENSPLVIHEAFIAGIPVVAARIGGITGLVKDGHTGLLHEAASAADLAEKLRRLVEDPSLLAALQRGVRSLPALKSIEDEAHEWDAVYRELVSGAAGVRSATS